VSFTHLTNLPAQVKALEQLQEIDLKIDRIRKDQGDMPAALKALDDTLAKSKGTVALKQAAIDEAHKIQRQAQAALDMNRDRVARASGKLESVQNTHEYQAASKEQEQLHKMAKTLEDQIKKCGVDIEALTKDLDGLNAQLAQAQASRDEQHGKLSGQSSNLQGQIDSLQAERKKFSSTVDARVLATYDRVRPARAGLGIVPSIGGRCVGCNMMVPPQLFNEIQKGSALHSCPSCHRLLYVKTETPATA
jgi:predicted  nucleic acid-binding Zn-ribbon protein